MPQNADVALTLGESDEACPLGLAPTSSTTATLVWVMHWLLHCWKRVALLPMILLVRILQVL
jgi:D-arabinose 5-phosphate isomerase GutQ